LHWNATTKVFEETDNSVWELPLSSNHISALLSKISVAESSRKYLLANLLEAFARLQSLGLTKLTVNPFVMVDSPTANKTDKYKSTVNADGEIQEWWQVADSEISLEEKDCRSFSKEERDIIIKAFYESDKSHVRQAAPLVEFRFLTGCRPGEAFALRWQDVFLGRDKNYVRFSKSYNGRLKNTQVTKTGETRLFKIYPKLNDLLLRIKPENAKPIDLVFVNSGGTSQTSGLLYEKWVNSTTTKKGVKYIYPGVVTQLANEGKISCYLSPYHTRHTFITLQAQSGTDLLLLATACGNSVEVIQRHYLGIDTTVEMTDV
jgi:integrase